MMSTKQLEPGLEPPADMESIADKHVRVAIEQSAMHAARLAIARWSSGGAFAQWQVDAALRPSVQASWYAQTQKNFQQWLECGGFSQTDMPIPK